MVEQTTPFGQYLKTMRNKNRLTLKQLADLADLSPSYLSRVERGERSIPNAPILKKLAPHLGLSTHEIMTAAGYLQDDTKASTRYPEPGGTPEHWSEIIKDPALDAVLEEIGPLTRDEKNGLLTYLRAIKLSRGQETDRES